MRVADICTRYVVTITPQASVAQAARQMRQDHVGSLVVVERANGGHRPVGVLTDRDVTVAVVAAGVGADAVSVGDAMSPELSTCSEDEDVFEAVSRMRNRGVRRLPVMDNKGALVGMLSADDVLGALAAELTDLGRAFAREQVREIERRR